MLYGTDCNSRIAADAALPQVGGAPGDAHENRIAGLLMETGTPYNKERLHGKAYFSELLGSLQDVPHSVVQLLKLSRGQLEFFATIQNRLLKGLRDHLE